jgi:hypothetical protein
MMRWELPDVAREQASKLLSRIPADFRGDFMTIIDRNTPVGQAMHDRCAMVVTDLGGDDNLSTVKRSTARDWAGLDVLVESLLCRLAAGEEIDAGSLVQLMNTKTGIARMLGLDRRPKQVRSLAEYMAGKAASSGEAA